MLIFLGLPESNGHYIGHADDQTIQEPNIRSNSEPGN